MPILPRTAIFGITPLTLMLGRACCLADNPPVGLHDRSPELALQGALLLGVAARGEPSDLDPAGSPLELALVGHFQAWVDLLSIPSRVEPFLAISLFPHPPTASTPWPHCQAVLKTPLSAEQLDAVPAHLPELVFELHGDPEAQKQGGRFLSSLSTRFRLID